MDKKIKKQRAERKIEEIKEKFDSSIQELKDIIRCLPMTEDERVGADWEMENLEDYFKETYDVFQSLE